MHNFFEYSNVLHITFINEIIEDVDTYFPITIDQIKENYKMVKKTTLTKKCIYTKWIR